MRAVVGFLGAKDVTFVRAEGVALGSEARERAIEAARVALVCSAISFPLLLRHRRIDPHHQVIGARHVRRPDGHAILQQLRQRVGAPGVPVQPSRHQHHAELAAAGQRRLEARPAIVLAAGDVGVFGNHGPALGCREGRLQRGDCSLQSAGVGVAGIPGAQDARGGTPQAARAPLRHEGVQGLCGRRVRR